MKIVYCWRCRMDIPMLDENEYESVSSLMTEGMSAVREYRERHNLPLERLTLEEHFAPALREYERLTGFKETNHVALYHHRLSLYGPECTECGKLLRTPEATYCVQCGSPRNG